MTVEGRGTQRALFLVAATALAIGVVITGCDDGATPDCSDAAAGCSPDLDGSIAEAAPTEDADPLFRDAAKDAAKDASKDAADVDDSSIDAGDSAGDSAASDGDARDG